ncbi:hypothetical protein GBF38_018825, partial [Nibea albiflora]
RVPVGSVPALTACRQRPHCLRGLDIKVQGRRGEGGGRKSEGEEAGETGEESNPMVHQAANKDSQAVCSIHVIGFSKNFTSSVVNLTTQFGERSSAH